MSKRLVGKKPQKFQMPNWVWHVALLIVLLMIIQFVVTVFSPERTIARGLWCYFPLAVVWCFWLMRKTPLLRPPMAQRSALKTYIKVTYADGAYCVCKPEEVKDMTEGVEGFSTAEVQMTESEYGSLPEFQG